ncbi:MAG: hypothetical protein ABWZ25_10195 [Chitinophagaceae bacterium]
MVGIFKQKNPFNLLVLLILGVVIKLPMFSNPRAPAMRPGDGVLYDAILRFLDPASRSFTILYPLLAFALLFIQAVWLNNFVNNQRMINKPSYLPGMSYLLVTSLLPEWNQFSPPLLVNTILLLVLSWLFSTYNKANAKGLIFNIGVALGIAGFLFISSLTFVLWVLLALAVMRPFRITEWLICLLGITTPFYFYAIFIVIGGEWSWQGFLPHVTIGMPSLKQSLWLAGSVFLIMVPFLVGGYYVQENLRRMLINVRKGWSLLLLYLMASLLLPFVNTTGTFENWLMAMIPMAAFHACTYFYSTWRPFAVLLFWLTLAYIFSYQYVGPGW